MFKNLPIIISLSLLVLFLASFCLALTAEDRPLEVPLPEIGSESGITATPLLPDYIKYIFNFAVVICGFVAFGVLVMGGVRYVASAGNPSTMSDANGQMLAGIMGLVIILGSWLILNTINPQLKVINLEYKESELVDEGTAEVLLCKDSGTENCKLFQRSVSTLGEINGQVNYIRFNNTEGITYGAVLHSKQNWQGNCVVCLESGCNIEKANGGYSITVFRQGDGGGGGGVAVTLYEVDSYNELCGTECKNSCSGFGEICGEKCIGWQDWLPDWTWRGGKCWPFNAGAYETTNIGLLEKVRSFYINEKGKYLVVRFDKTNFEGNCEVHRYSSMNIGAQVVKSLKVIPIK